MKRTLIVLFAGLLVFAVVGQAAAYFADMDLIQVVYNKDDKEVATSLFGLGTANFAGQNITVGPTGSFKLSQFSTLGPVYDSTDWASLRAAFFGYDGDTNRIYLSTTLPNAPGTNPNAAGGFIGGYDSIRAGYEGANPPQTNQTVLGNPAAQNSYFKVYNSGSSSQAGQYGGFNTSIANGELALADLGTVGYADMYLYAFSGADGTLISGANNPYTAVMRLFADGSTVMNPGNQAVPIPGAAILLASGLIGLVGIRRRKSN